MCCELGATNPSSPKDVSCRVAAASVLGTGTDEEDEIKTLCSDYSDGKLDALYRLLQVTAGNVDLVGAGLERAQKHKKFPGAVNYLAVYIPFTDRAKVLAMCDAMEGTMGVKPQTVGSFRSKVWHHKWRQEERGEALRMGMAGEGAFDSARKYSQWLSKDIDDRIAKDGRQANGKVSSDGVSSTFRLPRLWLDQAV